MVAAPSTTIQTSDSDRFVILSEGEVSVRSELEQIVLKYARLWLDRFSGELPTVYRSVEDLPIALNVVKACPRHAGLGSGTQLAMLTGLSLQQHFGLPTPKPEELSVVLGRANRSAIGTFGCFEGGLLVDRGKTTAESISPIDLRVDFPEHWPIAIVRVAGNQSEYPAGLHGADEESVFAEISPTSQQQLDQMRVLVGDRLVPGLLAEDYLQFADAVYEFGRRSGEYFAAIQGGPYASATIAKAVKIFRDAGILAVGQSSWGPSVFAIGENRQQLDVAVIQLQKQFGDRCEVEITTADNHGFRVKQEAKSGA